MDIRTWQQQGHTESLELAVKELHGQEFREDQIFFTGVDGSQEQAKTP